jgi:hypothetical protein
MGLGFQRPPIIFNGFQRATTGLNTFNHPAASRVGSQLVPTGHLAVAPVSLMVVLGTARITDRQEPGGKFLRRGSLDVSLRQFQRLAPFGAPEFRIWWVAGIRSITSDQFRSACSNLPFLSFDIFEIEQMRPAHRARVFGRNEVLEHPKNAPDQAIFSCTLLVMIPCVMA